MPDQKLVDPSTESSQDASPVTWDDRDTKILPFRRIVAIHAHPDDETITMGGTFARIMSEGGHVTLVTGTRGENGEVMRGVGAPGLAGDHAAMANFRTAELDIAMKALGVTEHEFLGEATSASLNDAKHTYTDSGMVWADGPGRRAIAPSDMAESALCRAPFAEQVEHLKLVLERVQPDAILTYEPGGGYGHPDHVRIHAITYAAAVATGRVHQLYYSVIPERAYQWAGERIDHVAPAAWTRPDLAAPRPASVVDDAEYARRFGVGVDVTDVRKQRALALSAHASQAKVVRGDVIDCFSMTDNIAQPLLPIEFYLPAKTAAEPVAPRETSTRNSVIIGILMGLVMAVIGVGLHRLVWPLGDTGSETLLPIGLILVAILSISLPVYLITATQRLLPVILGCFVWLGVAVVLGGPSVGDGTLVAGYSPDPITGARDWSGVLYYVLALVPMLAVLIFFWVRRLVGIVRSAK